ncbi:SLBB domain protein [compost metagenome]
MTIARFRPLRVTVLGQVARPGALDFEEAPSLLDVLATAGGLTEQASRKAVKVVDPAGKTQVYDLDGLLARPGDIPRLAEGSVVEVGQVWGPDLYRVTIPLLAAFISSAVWLLRP